MDPRRAWTLITQLPSARGSLDRVLLVGGASLAIVLACAGETAHVVGRIRPSRVADAGQGSAGAPASESSAGGGPPAGGAAGSPRGWPARCPGVTPRSDPVEACESTELYVDPVPVDMYLMVDTSSSMLAPCDEVATDASCTSRWEVLQQAVERFLDSVQEEDGDLWVGIQFFHYLRTDDCSSDKYSSPLVAMGPVAQVREEILAAIAAQVPEGKSPLLPALQGAIAHAKAHYQANPGRHTVVVLVTDGGMPSECGSLEEIVDAAWDGASTEPAIETYVLGLDNRFNLARIAEMGGTAAPYMVEDGAAPDDMLSRLASIADPPLACEYQFPPKDSEGYQPDKNRVQVLHTPFSGPTEEIPYVESLGFCEQGGWYYDDPRDPKQILTCPCTCSAFGAGKVEVRVGCAPQ